MTHLPIKRRTSKDVRRFAFMVMPLFRFGTFPYSPDFEKLAPVKFSAKRVEVNRRTGMMC